MRGMIAFSCFLGLTFGGPITAQAETDITAFLNDALSKKQKVSRVKTVKSLRRIDYWSGDVGPRSHWHDFVEESNEINFADFARVQRADVIEVRGMKLDETKVTTLPETALIARLNYFNCGPGTFSASETLSVTGTKGFSITKTQSISSSLSVGMNSTFSAGAAATPFQVTASVSLSESTSKSESHSTADGRSTTASISAQHGEAGYIEMLVYQTRADIPFSATVIVDGDLENNISGLSKASQLLTEPERTLNFSGVLHVEGLSNALTGNHPTANPFDCKNQPANAWITKSQQEIPAEDVSSQKKNKFTNAVVRSFSLKTGAELTTGVMSETEPNLPTIGARDGTSYEVVSSSKVQEPSVQCGFNDLAVPNAGEYLLENRHYETWIKGTFVAGWDEATKVFQQCLSGP